MENRQVTYENIKYGISVEYHNNNGGYHVGVKVHFFNKKGVLLGNVYEFVPYEKLKFKQNGSTYNRFFYRKRFEKIKSTLFKIPLNMITYLIKFTQKYMD
jgi:hypothetical protein